MENKMVKSEKIKSITTYFIVAIPDNLDEFILVSLIPESIIEGCFQYNDGTAEYVDYMDEVKRLLSEEHAKKFIMGYKSGMKLTLVNAFCNYGIENIFSDEEVKRANRKLREKLEGMTLKEFYGKWR